MGWERGLALAIGALLGTAIGIGGFTFAYARGFAYVTDDPAACANCHVMHEQLDGWRKSSHHAVAVCNDCHTPHDLVGKYTVKAVNGFLHSYAFTTGDFPEPIRITERNRRVTEQTCRGCHTALAAGLDGAHAEQVACLRCHPSVGHLERAAVGSTPREEER
jgi:cytochrome c nitrite reductase small subunit